ncbi:GreA/GreB family elongation factor [Microbacterium marinilacus]|nr:GreA/GreB family elongation factor [Microbacterium marinilacus]MBY0688264.1 GreA/GreB family elongation factor [Microbacterium marinilacus]
MSLASDPLWMTSEALTSLQDELSELTRPGHEQSSEETARAVRLRELIRRAEVGTKPDDGLVEPGMTVTVRFEADGSTETFLLGDRELLGGREDVDVSSPSSPLGSALNGRHVGDRLSYSAPSGSLIEVTVVSAVPFV